MFRVCGKNTVLSAILIFDVLSKWPSGLQLISDSDFVLLSVSYEEFGFAQYSYLQYCQKQYFYCRKFAKCWLEY